LKLCRQRRLGFDVSAAERVREAESVRVQELPSELEVGHAVHKIADEGKVNRGQVN